MEAVAGALPEPIKVIARGCHHFHAGGHVLSLSLIEDTVANIVADFYACGQHRYNKSKCLLRFYLRMLTNARFVDLLRQERPIDHKPLTKSDGQSLPGTPEDTPNEADAFQRALLAKMTTCRSSNISAPHAIFKMHD